MSTPVNFLTFVIFIFLVYIQVLLIIFHLHMLDLELEFFRYFAYPWIDLNNL